MASLPDPLNVLIMTRLNEHGLERIRAIAPDRLNVVLMGNEFGEEEVWPPNRTRRGVPPTAGSRSAEERDALWREAHVLYLALPFPVNLARRAEKLIWAHFSFAGVSNLRGSAFWDPPYIVTSTRGRNQALPIAESVIAASLMFTRRLQVAVRQTDAADFTGTGFAGMKLIRGKTMAIVGLGGIGAKVAQLAKGIGMRVVATRRSAKEREANVDGVDVLYPSYELHAMLAEADFIAVCAMLTDETERMLDDSAFAATKEGAYILNVARGEIVDEAALAAALTSGRLAGAYLDVWDNDMVDSPSEVLQKAPNVIFTPHVSGRADSQQGFSLDIFCENLALLLEGRPLQNVVDWQRGY
jgi:phosphoglycerate dehydrogenase-like enzyme